MARLFRKKEEGHATTHARGRGKLAFAPHGERVQALMLCSLDCAVSGAHPDRKAKADGRFIITPWWCLNKCRWLPEHRGEIRFVAKKVGLKTQKKSPSRREPRGGFFAFHTAYRCSLFLRRWEDAFLPSAPSCFGAGCSLHIKMIR